MAIEDDLDDHRIGIAELLLIEDRDIFLDDAGLFEAADAIPAGRGREADLLGEIDVLNPPVELNRPQDSQCPIQKFLKRSNTLRFAC
jgi:hypothetical protein